MAKITKTKMDFSKKRRMVEKQEFLFISRIQRFSKNGIQVSRTPDGKGKFWVDTESYYNKNETLLEDDFDLKDPVKMVLTYDSYINKNDEYVVKANLVDIEKFDEKEMQYWIAQQPTHKIKAEVVSITTTDMHGLVILEAYRLDNENTLQDRYFFRYYNKSNRELVLGRYEIDFDLYTTARIIQSDGQVFRKEEASESEPTKTWPIYVPYLEANHIYELVSSQE